MKITRITIENFRAYSEPTTVDFPHTFTSLVGKNGSGKTSILEAMNLATSFYFVENKISEDDFNDDSKEIKIEIEFDEYFFLDFPDGFHTKKLPCKTVRLTVKHREKAAPAKAFSDPYIAVHEAIPVVFTSKKSLDIEDTANIPISLSKVNGGYSFARETGTSGKIHERLLRISNNLDGFPNVFYLAKNRDKDLRKGFASIFQKIGDSLGSIRKMKMHEKHI